MSMPGYGGTDSRRSARAVFEFCEPAEVTAGRSAGRSPSMRCPPLSWPTVSRTPQQYATEPKEEVRIAAAVGDAADFFHVQVDHVSGVLGSNRLDLPVVLAVGVDESAAVQAELGQVAGDRAPTDGGAVGMQLECDAGCRPLALAPQLLDPGDGLAGYRSRLPEWRGRAVV